MSTIADFNRIEDCNKTDAQCINAYVDAHLDEEDPKLFKIETSWGSPTVDLSPAVKTEETLTTMYLSPATSPNCLVYEPERGDNICIHGDDLSRIMSMTKLKDVDQDAPVIDEGEVYMLGNDGLFHPFDLQTFVDNTNASIADLQGRMTTLEQLVATYETRIQTLEAMLVPPTGTPAGARVVFGNINVYADTSASINSAGTAVSLNKTHGLYTHDTNSNVYGDEVVG